MIFFIPWGISIYNKKLSSNHIPGNRLKNTSISQGIPRLAPVSDKKYSIILLDVQNMLI